MTEAARAGLLGALLRQRCPACRRGPVFATSTRMNERCPACGLVFEREEGYFLGAMYISYGLSSLLLILGMLAAHLIWPEMDLGWAVLLAVVAYLPFVPAVFRYSRVMWIYFDRWLWPDERPGGAPAPPRHERDCE
jgi:uncharacterized protein (DUF983 family)